MGIDFSGSGQYIDCGTTSGNTLGATTTIGVSFWFNADAQVNDGMFYIGTFSNAVGAFEIVLSASNFFMRSSGYGITFNQNIAFTDLGNWHHIVGTFTGSFGDLYLDGVRGVHTAETGTITFTGLKNIICGYYNTPFLFDGKMFDVRLYTRGLTQADVDTIYHSRGNDNITNGLIMRQLMQGTNGATATTAQDVSPAGVSCSVTGSPTYLATAQKLI